jgi:hypothetical protein
MAIQKHLNFVIYLPDEKKTGCLQLNDSMYVQKKLKMYLPAKDFLNGLYSWSKFLWSSHTDFYYSPVIGLKAAGHALIQV